MGPPEFSERPIDELNSGPPRSDDFGSPAKAEELLAFRRRFASPYGSGYPLFLVTVSFPSLNDLPYWYPLKPALADVETSRGLSSLRMSSVDDKLLFFPIYLLFPFLFFVFPFFPSMHADPHLSVPQRSCPQVRHGGGSAFRLFSHKRRRF